MFSRVGKLNPADVAAVQQPAVAAEAVYGYRNKVQMAFSSFIWHSGASQAQPGHQQQHQQQQQGAVREGVGLGYFLPGSNSVVVPIQECSLLVSAFAFFLPACRITTQCSKVTEKRRGSIRLHTNKTCAQVSTTQRRKCRCCSYLTKQRVSHSECL
jgi:hypothetical protein